jgi:hypothetical protein
MNTIEYIDMGDFGVQDRMFGRLLNKTRNPPNEITLVSAFFDIDRAKWRAHSRTSENYVESFLFYLRIDYRMVVFVDDRYIQKVLDAYQKSPFQNKTFIPINRKWLETNIFAWQQLPRDVEIMKSEKYRSLVVGKDNPENLYSEYNLINHAKIDFIMYAIQYGFIEDDFVCWADFGYHWTLHRYNDQSTYFPTSILDISRFSTKHINFCVRNKIDPEKHSDRYFILKNAPDLMTGTVFAATKENMAVLQELVHKHILDLHEYDISDDDQHIYLRCVLDRPELFRLYHSPHIWPMALTYFQAV